MTRFLGLTLADLTLDQALDAVGRQAAAPRFGYIVTPNVDHIVQLYGDHPAPWRDTFAAAYRDAALRLCDSRVLALLARATGVRLSVVPGSDLTRALVERGPRDAHVLLVGGGAGHRDWLTAARPDWRIDHYAPPMGVRDDPAKQDATVAAIEAAAPAITLFAIGAPQSELVAHKLWTRGRVGGVGLCIGASISFLTGEVKRAPVWMQRLSLEWLHRLLSEPGRLWRRYLVDGPRVFAIWWRRRGVDQAS